MLRRNFRFLYSVGVIRRLLSKSSSLFVKKTILWYNFIEYGGRKMKKMLVLLIISAVVFISAVVTIVVIYMNSRQTLEERRTNYMVELGNSFFWPIHPFSAVLP